MLTDLGLKRVNANTIESLRIADIIRRSKYAFDSVLRIKTAPLAGLTFS